jgi:hypothetical protein
MRKTIASGVAFSLAASLFLLSACGREQNAAPTPPAATTAPMAGPETSAAQMFRVSRIDLGTAIDDNKRVTDPTAVFKPTDTIYASVVSEGASPTVTLVAAWTYGDGQVVSSSSQTIAPTGPATTEFHISKSSGWPAGKYQVNVLASDGTTTVREFEVRE